MPRRIRFIPEGGALVEVTSRTIHGRFLLKPSPILRSVIVGILARAVSLFPVEIHAFVFLSNHYHILLSVNDAGRLSQFMNYLNSNLAREAGRLYRWKEKFWGRRYQAIVVSDEERAQVSRLSYLLSHGCKEGLVPRPVDWPGANCVEALTIGEPLTGLWFDRTREYSARARGESPERMQYASRLRLNLAPLPCWADMSEEQHRRRVREMVSRIVDETQRRHVEGGTRPVGLASVLNQHPHDCPRTLEKRPAPMFHAATKAVRRELTNAYRWFVGSYREAARRLRMGHRRVSFPPGSFPPRLPFVPSPAASGPG